MTLALVLVVLVCAVLIVKVSDLSFRVRILEAWVRWKDHEDPRWFQ